MELNEALQLLDEAKATKLSDKLDNMEKELERGKSGDKYTPESVTNVAKVLYQFAPSGQPPLTNAKEVSTTDIANIISRFRNIGQILDQNKNQIDGKLYQNAKQSLGYITQALQGIQTQGAEGEVAQGETTGRQIGTETATRQPRKTTGDTTKNTIPRTGPTRGR